MKPATFGPVYALGLYPELAELFRRHGYALAIHGSVARDFDLIAVPWIEEAGEPGDVMAEVFRTFAIVPGYRGEREPGVKPHGRRSYTVSMSFADLALDISFTPRARG